MHRIISVLFLTLVLSGCSIFATPTPEVIMVTATPEPTPELTNTPESTSTPKPTQTSKPTPTEEPKVRPDCITESMYKVAVNELLPWLDLDFEIDSDPDTVWNRRYENTDMETPVIVALNVKDECIIGSMAVVLVDISEHAGQAGELLVLGSVISEQDDSISWVQEQLKGCALGDQTETKMIGGEMWKFVCENTTGSRYIVASSVRFWELED